MHMIEVREGGQRLGVTVSVIRTAAPTRKG